MKHFNFADSVSSDNTVYLVKLKPADKFFFGGEHTFGEDNETYFVHSLPFPQQTTILGMIRRELLIQNGLSEQGRARDNITDMNKAEAAIGKESFTIDYNGEQDFGWIKSISPVFLALGSRYYIKVPFDFDFSYKSLDEEHAGCLLGKSRQKGFIPYLKGYSAKQEGLNDGFIHLDSHEKLSFGDVFIKVTQVGITKNNRRENEEKAFFKQTCYAFNKDRETGFAFLLELIDKSGNEPVKFENSFVMLGAEGNIFKMEVEKAVNLSFSHMFRFPAVSSQHASRIVLLSDTYVKEDMFEACDFAMTRIISFRNIYSKSLTHFASRPGKTRYCMVERGSVFYLKDCKESEKMLSNNNLQKIGYNIFQIIKGRE
jgi:CRISPR-associated protein Cmr3